MTDALARLVRRRAAGACEYCRIPEWALPGPFEYEHVVARQHGGRTVAGNLAYACPHCNRHKGPNVASFDRATSRNRPVRLLHPRQHRWAFHFARDGPLIVGRTPIGRVTVRVLAMNDEILVPIRERLIFEGLWPPA